MGMAGVDLGVVKPRHLVPMSAMAFWTRMVISLPVTSTNFPGFSGVGLVVALKREHTGVFVEAPAGKSFMDWTMEAQVWTGQRSHFLV
jgi:hypothetical protein